MISVKRISRLFYDSKGALEVKSAKKPPSPLLDKLDEDVALFRDTKVWERKFNTLSSAEFLRLYSDGWTVYDKKGGMDALLTSYREVIPVHARLSRSQRRLILKDQFTFTANQDFIRVMHHCAKPRAWRKPGTEPWIGRKTKKILWQLYQDKQAHSVEAYADGELVAGVLGIQSGGLFVALSIFSAYAGYSGTGNAVVAAMMGALHQAGFTHIDALVPSAISRSFGGTMVEMCDHFYERQSAVALPVQFPEYSTPRSIAEFLQPR